jgi:hypothetical protein
MTNEEIHEIRTDLMREREKEVKDGQAKMAERNPSFKFWHDTSRMLNSMGCIITDGIAFSQTPGEVTQFVMHGTTIFTSFDAKSLQKDCEEENYDAVVRVCQTLLYRTGTFLQSVHPEDWDELPEDYKEGVQGLIDFLTPIFAEMAENQDK